MALITLGVVLLASAVGLALSGIGRGPAATQQYPCGLQACRASQTKVPLRGYEGAYIAADPKAPDHVVITDTDLLAAECGWHTTFDGGRTWTDGAFTLPPGFTGCRLNNPSGGHVPSGSVIMGAYGGGTRSSARPTWPTATERAYWWRPHSTAAAPSCRPGWRWRHRPAWGWPGPS